MFAHGEVSVHNNCGSGGKVLHDKEGEEEEEEEEETMVGKIGSSKVEDGWWSLLSVWSGRASDSDLVSSEHVEEEEEEEDDDGNDGNEVDFSSILLSF